MQTDHSVFPENPTWEGDGSSRVPFWAYTRETCTRKNSTACSTTTTGATSGWKPKSPTRATTAAP